LCPSFHFSLCLPFYPLFQVVKLILSEHPHFQLTKLYPDFPSRGKPYFPTADCCVRTEPTVDRTIGAISVAHGWPFVTPPSHSGFFVACFERRPDEAPAAAPSNTTHEGTSTCKKKRKRKRKASGTASPAQQANCPTLQPDELIESQPKRLKKSNDTATSPI